MISRMGNEDSSLCLVEHKVWGRISLKPFQIKTWFQRPPVGNGLHESNGHVTDDVT